MTLRASLAALFAGLSLIAGCAPATGPFPPAQGQLPGPPPVPAITRSQDFPGDAASTARAFVEVLKRMEPAVERECLQRRTAPINCDFQFTVEQDPRQEVNAFQAVDQYGRPVIGFTLALIAAARNADELAFVVGHEASHHILNHISQKNASARNGALIFGALATAGGADPSAIEGAQQFGAQFGARYYSKDWELQADYLGAIITRNAGYDPVHGAQFFMRIPDPGNRVLGSHPARSERISTVQRAVGDLQQGRFY